LDGEIIMFTFSWSSYPSDEIVHKHPLLNEGNNGYYKNYHYRPIILGSIIKSSNSLSGPSYKEIKTETIINRDGTGAPLNKAEIKDNQVFLNDILIASAPSGKTKAQREKFCKAIVWSLMNDSECLKDKLREISGNQDKPIVVVESIPEKVKSLIPIIPAGFISWLNLTITEERCTA